MSQRRFQLRFDACNACTKPQTHDARRTASQNHLLLEYTGSSDDIEVPWYTGNFDATYNDVMAGCQALLDHLVAQR